MVGIGLVLGVVLQRTVRGRAIADAARTGEVAANVGVRPFLEVSDLERNFVPLPPDRIAMLDASLGDSLSPDGIVRIKIWNRQHWLVYSDHEVLRGRWFAGTDILERSFLGELTSEITDLSAPEEREEREFGELLAVYVPLRTDGDGEFTSDEDAEIIGAFEIYLPWAPIAAAIRADTIKVWLALGVGLLLLYLTLFELVARASRQLARKTEENLFIATHDTLTGLANREAFRQAVADRLDELERGSGAGNTDTTKPIVMLFDLDRFQVVNDTLGHEAGDRLLVILAERLDGLAGERDTVARLGGDEFALLVPAVATSEISATVSLLARVMNTTVELDGLRVEVNASVGVVTLEPGMDADGVMQKTDIALYEAKRRNSRVEFFRPALDRFSSDSLALAGEIRAGIERSEFVVHYQPKYSLVTGAMTGLEALVRWIHPTRGVVPPGSFIPMVEQLPIGRDLTAFVLTRAVDDMVSWHLRGLEIGVAVNLSARDVNDAALAPFVEQLLAARGLDGTWLTLELTEGSMLEDEDRTVSTLTALRRHGCGVAIDDFGTGYAAISYLMRLPATEVKVDRSFIAEIENSPQARKIVEHCVGLARSLGMSVTAEGIENHEVERLAAALGCDTGQGYYRSRPMSVGDLHDLVTTEAARRRERTMARTET